MCNIINIVDFSYLYYKYKFTHQGGKLQTLTYQDQDITLLYYPLREIEIFSKSGEIPTAICFDAYIQSMTHEEVIANQQKGNFQNDLCNIFQIKEILTDVGYATYLKEGMGAEHLVASLCKHCYKQYDEIHIYTMNSSLIQLVTDKVTVHLYKQKQGYIEITKDNFEETVTKLYKVYIPFNALSLYKSLCGDKSNKVLGIKGFGPSRFASWVKQHPEVTYAKCTHPNKVWEVITTYFDASKQEQALIALKQIALTTNIEVDNPIYTGNPSTRVGVYSQYGMDSLI